MSVANLLSNAGVRHGIAAPAGVIGSAGSPGVQLIISDHGAVQVERVAPLYLQEHMYGSDNLVSVERFI